MSLNVRFALKRPGGGRVVVTESGITMLSHFSGGNDGWSVVKACDPSLNVGLILDLAQGYLSEFPAPVGRVVRPSFNQEEFARFSCCDGDYLFSTEAITAAFGWLKGGTEIKTKPCCFSLRGMSVSAIVVLLESGDRQVLLSPCVPRAGHLEEWNTDWNSSAIIEVRGFFCTQKQG